MESIAASDVEQRIHKFLLEKFPLARKTKLERNTALLEKGILDSLGILDVVSFLESEFSITINDEELVPENFQDLETLSAFVGKKCKKSE
jgi:acyl carrier protein